MILPDKIDRSILFFVNNDLHDNFFNHLFIFFSDRRSLIYFIPLIILYGYYLKKKNGKEFNKLIVVIGMAVVAVSISDLLTSRIVKPLFARPRPCQVIEGLYFFKQKASVWVLTDGISSYKSSFSFVSSHASNSISAALIFGKFYRKLIPFLSVAVLLISTSRLYLGVHYPSDILGGWITGVITALIVFLIFYSSKKKYLFLRIQTFFY